jgi:hypothetical protein
VKALELILHSYRITNQCQIAKKSSNFLFFLKLFFKLDLRYQSMWFLVNLGCIFWAKKSLLLCKKVCRIMSNTIPISSEVLRKNYLHKSIVLVHWSWSNSKELFYLFSKLWINWFNFQIMFPSTHFCLKHAKRCSYQLFKKFNAELFYQFLFQVFNVPDMFFFFAYFREILPSKLQIWWIYASPKFVFVLPTLYFINVHYFHVKTCYIIIFAELMIDAQKWWRFWDKVLNGSKCLH